MGTGGSRVSVGLRSKVESPRSIIAQGLPTFDIGLWTFDVSREQTVKAERKLRIRILLLPLAVCLLLPACRSAEDSGGKPAAAPEVGRPTTRRAPTGLEEELPGKIRAEAVPIRTGEVLQVVVFLRKTVTRKQFRIERVDPSGRVVDSGMEWEETEREAPGVGGLPVAVSAGETDHRVSLTSGKKGRIVVELAYFASKVPPKKEMTLILTWEDPSGLESATGRMEVPVAAAVLQKVRETFPSGPAGPKKPKPQDRM